MICVVTILVTAVSPTIVQSRGLIAYTLTEEKPKIELTMASLPPVADRAAKKIALAVVKKVSQGNRFVPGNCTWWVANRRNAIKQPVTWSGNANAWFENAKKQGYNLGSTPQPGAIYVNRNENSLGSRLGHVAFVEKVVGDKTLLSEMNWVGKYKVSYRWIPTNKSGVGYIYNHP